MERLADRYELGDALGQGRSTVYRALDTRLRRNVAIKRVQLLAGQEDAEQVRTRALREARASARLNNPSAVAVFDVVEEDGAIWLVMELVDGPSLAQIVADHGPLPHDRAAAIGLGVLTALEAAHLVGVVHRDVKPANVLVRDGDRAMLTDFGVATIRDESRVTATGLIVGSPSYMSPEQATGGDITPATDLWALGALLYFAVEGEPPFPAGNALATASAVVHGDPRAQQHPGPLSLLLTRLFAKDPAARARAGEVRATLSRVASGRDSRLAAAPSATPAAAESPPAPAPAASAASRPSAPSAAAPDPAASASAAAPDPAASATLPAAAQAPDAGAPPSPSASSSDPTAVHAVPGQPAAGQQAVEPPVPPSRARRSRHSRRPLVAAGAGLLLVGLIAAAVPSLRDRDGGSAGDGATPATTSAPAASSTSAPEPTTTTSTTVPAGTLPAGWTPFRDPQGAYTIGLPPGWRVEQTSSPQRVDLVDPATGSLLRIEWTDTPGPSAAGAWHDLAPVVASNNANYETIGINQVPYRNYDAALWEFRHGAGEILHTGNLGFIANGRGYALMFRTPESRWDAGQPVFEQFKQAFSPT